MNQERTIEIERDSERSTEFVISGIAFPNRRSRIVEAASQTCPTKFLG